SALFQGMVSSIDNWNFVQRNTMLDGPITIRKAQKPTFQSGTQGRTHSSSDHWQLAVRTTSKLGLCAKAPSLSESNIGQTKGCSATRMFAHSSRHRTWANFSWMSTRVAGQSWLCSELRTATFPA
ncbi:MAG: hypothetical protein OXB95_07045, partial [Rhodobacteraceae bacterium]|nr:hypothetical protein [Paracoccaceae bacterium]